MLLGHKMVTCLLTSMVDSNLGLYSVQFSNLQTFGQFSQIRSDKIKIKARTPQLLPAVLHRFSCTIPIERKVSKQVWCFECVLLLKI